MNDGYILREHQSDALLAMLENNIGRITLPTGIGKSVIQAAYCKEFIQNINSKSIIVILSPRIILSYQLLNVIIKHLTFNKIKASYINLSSGEIEISNDVLLDAKKNNLIHKDIISTTDIDVVQKYIDSSTSNNTSIIISATYHSGWKLKNIKNKIDVVLHDEAHNIVCGKFSEDFKQETLLLKSYNKFFFTATPCYNDKPSGMNNIGVYGEEIYYKSFKEMIDKKEILPIVLKSINIPTLDNSHASAIKISYLNHQVTVQTNSNNALNAKLLITVNGGSNLNNILHSKQIQELIDNKINVYAISTELKYFKNGTFYTKYDFKERFIADIQFLKDTDPCIILHIDMIGEGVDVSGITGVMAFTVIEMKKAIQLLGRAMRLITEDRKSIYRNEIKQLIKPYAYMLIPIFYNEYSINNIYALFDKYIKLINESYDWIPYITYDKQDQTCKELESYFIQKKRINKSLNTIFNKYNKYLVNKILNELIIN